MSLTEEMEEMSSSLYLDQVPVRWAKLAYPSMLPLTAWITDLQQRHKELDVWLVDFQVTICFVNPPTSILNLRIFRRLRRYGLEDFSSLKHS